MFFENDSDIPTPFAYLLRLNDIIDIFLKYGPPFEDQTFISERKRYL